MIKKAHMPFVVLLSSLVCAGVLSVDSGSARADDDSGSGPLKVWMKKQMGARMGSKDYEGLEKAFNDCANFAGPKKLYPDWEKISKEGAAAAKGKDFKGVKAACTSCHDAHKKDYKESHRADPI